MVLAPYAVDVGLGALAIHENPDVAFQLALIDFEVLTLAGMTQLLGSRLTGRLRPSFYDKGCPPEGCPRGDDFRSFLSGHAMATFTAAGLMCVHHEMIPLFGGGAPDPLACAWGISAATLVSTMRIVAGRSLEHVPVDADVRRHHRGRDRRPRAHVLTGVPQALAAASISRSARNINVGWGRALDSPSRTSRAKNPYCA
jgi:hypothetical protein